MRDIIDEFFITQLLKLVDDYNQSREIVEIITKIKEKYGCIERIPINHEELHKVIKEIRDERL